MKKIRLVSIILILFAWIGAFASPKYVFYFIGDGMGMGHVMATQIYNREVLRNDKPILMMQFPIVSMAMTYSATGPVTDSAAAGTALSTGYKTLNGMLGVTPDSVDVTSVAKEFKDNGFGVGVVTSVSPDDATPGAFYAHKPSRSMYYEIGKDMAVSGYDFIAGATLRGAKDKGGKPTDLMEILEQNGVSVAFGIDAIKSAKTDKMLLLNTDTLRVNNIGYTIDSIKNGLTLPQMTRACLSHLEKTSPDKFFMMVEGGNIDHAAHSNDGGAVIKEVLNFNEAIAIAYDFYLAHPDETLIVVTADHDTGGFTIGNKYLGYDAKVEYIDYQRISKDMFSAECYAILRSRSIFTWEDMKEMLTDKLGFWSHIPVTEVQEGVLKEKFEDTFTHRNSKDEKTLYGSFNEFTVSVFKLLNDVSGLGWTTSGHTGNPVPVFAIGVGATEFSNLNNNTEIPIKIRNLSGFN